MKLDQSSIARWIEALRSDLETPVVVPADKSLLSQFAQDAQWRLGVYFSAYFYVPDDSAVDIGVAGVPRLFQQFDTITRQALTHEKHPRTGNVLARGMKSLPGIAERFEAGRQSVASINAFSEGTKESSPRYFFNAVCSFKPASRPGGPLQMFSYVTARVPLSFWRDNRTSMQAWWLDLIEWLQPEQAYAGIAFGLPPVQERYPFFEPAEFALCQVFYGLDVDKPFFMVGSPYCEHSMHLELGTRTPTFGTLLRGKYLDRLGGEAAVRQALSDDPRFHLTPRAGGLWIEAGDEPALYPVDQGIPRHYAKLAKLMKPTRLEALWLISYLPPLPRDDCFNAQKSARWLKRFDDDGDWPLPEVRFWRPDDGGASGTQGGSTRSNPDRALPGEPAPRTGWWRALALDGTAARVYLLAGQALPGPDTSARGRVIWQYDFSQDGSPPGRA